MEGEATAELLISMHLTVMKMQQLPQPGQN